MLLAIDIGNTHTVAGVFDGEKLRGDWRFRTAPDATADEVGVTFSQLLTLSSFQLSDISSIAISSVVPTQTEAYRSFCERVFTRPPLIVGPGTRTGIRIASDNPHEVGADRIVNAVAAFERFGGACIVVDMGTATTYDAIGSDGAYLGGAIAPGLGISIEALVARAARLASVELEVPERAIGTNTVASMQSGAMLGTVAQVEGMIERFRQEMASHKRPADDLIPGIATGGQAAVIAAHIEGLEYDPLLTLRGLQLVAARSELQA